MIDSIHQLTTTITLLYIVLPQYYGPKPPSKGFILPSPAKPAGAACWWASPFTE